MSHRGPSPSIARAAIALASAAMVLGGCAEMHRGFEAVGRVGGTPAAEAQTDVAPDRTDVKTVRARGSARRRAVEESAAEPPAARYASAVPSPRQIFDFHPPGASPDAWRQPFVIDTSDGPLAADVRRSTAELRAFLADQKAGRGRAGTEKAAGARCGENDVATGKPGCAAGPRRAAAVAAPNEQTPR